MTNNQQGEEGKKSNKEYIVLKNIQTSFRKNYIRCKNYIEKYIYSDNPKDNVLHLCPANEIEHKEYENSILCGIKKKDVKNIAITGTYGSGKSSIIKNFQNKHPEYNYLFISMATFEPKEKKETEKIEKENEGTEKVEYELEKNILQQIIYATKYDLVPKSRFSKLKNNSFYKLLLFFGIFSFSVYKIFYESSIIEFGKDSLFASRFIFFFCIYVFIKSVYIKLSSLKITQLIFKELELNVFKEEDSAFNKYIDEIIYHFQGNKIDVVILEDIDRFNDIEIFNKLRELNLLLNNSNEINRKITFIYAIRDDLFEESEDRTKFFDTLIPVIPYVSSANIGSKFVEILENLNLLEKNIAIDNNTDEITTNNASTKADITQPNIQLDRKIIFDLSLFVTNIREVNTIITEYRLYESILKQEKIKPTNLMAMMFYKIKYPKDFCDLQFDKGNLYTIITSKSPLKKFLIEDIEIKIKNNDNKIKEIKNNISNENAKNIEELCKIFVQKAIQKLDDGYTAIDYNGVKNIIPFLKLIENPSEFEKAFEKRSFRFHHSNYGWRNSIELWTNDEMNDYKSRKNYILNKESKEIEVLNDENKKLSEDKNTIKTLRLSEVLNIVYKHENILSDNLKKIIQPLNDYKLINYIINNDLIDETNYHLYISHFVAGQKTKTDNDFLLDLKLSKCNYKPDYSIVNIELILDHIREELDNNLILNIKIFEFIYEFGIDKTYKNNLFNALIKLDYYEHFIKDILHEKEALDFIDDIINYDEEFWILVEKSDLISNNKKDFVVRHLLMFYESETLLKMNIKNSLSDYVANIEYIPTNLINDKFINNIKNLNVKFNKLSDSTTDKRFIEYLYNNKLYELNYHMINKIIKYYNNEIDMEFSDYNDLGKYINLIGMKTYIEGNLNQFIEKYYLNDNVPHKDESSDYITKILSNKDINQDNRRKVIEKTDAKIKCIAEISGIFWTNIFQYKRAEGNMINLKAYADYESKDNIILFNFINENCNEIFIEECALEEIQEILEDACGSPFLSLETLKVVKNKTLFEFNISGYGMMNEQILENLIEANLITFDYDNIAWVSKNCTKELKHKYIFNNLDKFIKDSSATFTSPKLTLDLINDLDYNNQQKLKLIEKVYIKNCQTDEFIEASINIIKNSKDIVLPKQYLIWVITKLNGDNEKFAMIKRFERNVNKENIFEFLHYLKNPISKIYENKEKVTVHRDNFTIEIANFLSNLGVARFSVNENTDKITIIKIN